MKFYLETTLWPGGGSNHRYLMTDDRSKIVAYIRHGSEEVFTFKKPITFSTRGRTFVAIPNTFGYNTTEKVKQSVSEVTRGVRVIGSKGDVYYVSNVGGVPHCTCSGFAFRRKCKHLSQI
jgi:hypothetical protein